jgi:polysaccharide biosynthesis/export protein
MSVKVRFPLSALAICPLALLAAYSKASGEASKAPDEAPANLTVAKLPQQTNDRAIIDAAHLSATVRPESLQPTSERAKSSVHAAHTTNLAVIPAPPPARLLPVRARMPITNLNQTRSTSARQIVDYLIASAQSPRSVAPIQSPKIEPSPAVSSSAMPPAVEPSPTVLSAVESPAASVALASARTVAPIAVLPQETLPRSPEADVAPETSIAVPESSPRSPVDEGLQPIVLSSSNQTKPGSEGDLIPLANQKAESISAAESIVESSTKSQSQEHNSSTAQVAPPVAIAPEQSIQVPERSVQVVSSTTTPIAQVVPAQAPSAPLPSAPLPSAPLPSAPLPSAPLPPAQVPSVQTSPAQVAAPQPDIIGESYVLGAGDRINVNFFNVPEYSGEFQVAADGSVNLPVVGTVSIAGLTIPETSSFIANLYQAELAHPRVTVNLTARRPLQVSIIGEVGKPGLYTLGADQSAQVIQAIQTAGGLTQSANLRQVQIRRSFRGQTQTIALNVQNLLENGDLTQNLTLQDGDSLYIPATDTVNLVESGQLANSTLASTTSTQVKIALVGEVNRPGSYQLPSTAGARATLTQAIQTAGGITPTADVRQVQIRRTTRGGETQAINIDLWQFLQSGDPNQDVILQDGDAVVLTKAEQLTPAESIQLASTNLSPAAIQVNLIGEVKNPGSVQLPSSITLNQALLQAGGLNSRARRSAQLVRINPNGTLTRRVIAVDFKQDANVESNPVLQNNDVVIVGRSTLTQIGDGVSNIVSPILRILSPLQFLLGL